MTFWYCPLIIVPVIWTIHHKIDNLKQILINPSIESSSYSKAETLVLLIRTHVEKLSTIYWHYVAKGYKWICVYFNIVPFGASKS